MRELARAAVRRALDGQGNPIEILLAIAADEGVNVDTRVVAATAAAPYMYPRLSAAVVESHHTVTKVDSAELLGRLSERIGKLVPPPPAIEGEAVEQPDEAAA